MICIVVALASEARPLLNAYGLKRDHSIHEFPVYYDPQHKISLIVSGSGAFNTAVAVGFIAGRHAQHQLAWLNVGIAGCSSAAIGDCYIAHRIIHDASGQYFYPYIYPDDKINGGTIITVAQPELSYPENVLYDMEAAGFFVASQRLSSIEFIRSVKVISDNCRESAHALKAKQVSTLLQNQMDNIDRVFNNLCKLQQQHVVAGNLPDDFLHWCQQRHVTESQKNNLLLQFRQLQAIGESDYLLQLNLESYTDVRVLLRHLQQRLEQYEITL